MPGPEAGPPAVAAPVTRRSFRCRCGRPIFFRNSQCLACGTPLGYHPQRLQMWPLAPAGPNRWRHAGRLEGRGRGPALARCANLESAAACNWLVDREGSNLCRCCRLTRVLPDLSQPDNARDWGRIAVAQRRLVSALIAFGLPLQGTPEGAPDLVFELRRAEPGGPSPPAGHADGVITLDVEEADDARREQRRAALHEPYRTLLGHLRHESGHYYWQRLVQPQETWLQEFRALFGDEREDYAAALQRHYDQGPPADWGARHISAYASSHPWEDWAETWAHYLHLRDTLDTARSFGLDGSTVELEVEPFGPAALQAPDDPSAPAFLSLVNGWLALTGVLNEISRSMGMADFYPFVLSAPALGKLHLVHRVVSGSGSG